MGLLAMMTMGQTWTSETWRAWKMVRKAEHQADESLPESAWTCVWSVPVSHRDLPQTDAPNVLHQTHPCCHSVP